MCSRQLPDRILELDTSGYTLNNTFVLYDQETDSLWYPRKEDGLDAVSGPAQGAHLEFDSKPLVRKLGDWRREHPDTLIMVPPPLPEVMQQRLEAQLALLQRFVGVWRMQLQFPDRQVQGRMVLRAEGAFLAGEWRTQGNAFPLQGLGAKGQRIWFQCNLGGHLARFQGMAQDDQIRGMFRVGNDQVRCEGSRLPPRPRSVDEPSNDE